MDFPDAGAGVAAIALRDGGGATGELITQDFGIRLGDALEMTVFPGVLTAVKIGRPPPPPATASSPSRPAPRPAQMCGGCRPGFRGTDAPAEAAEQKDELAATMAKAMEARAAGKPEAAAELEKRAMDLQASMDKTQAQSDQLQKAAAEAAAPSVRLRLAVAPPGAIGPRPGGVMIGPPGAVPIGPPGANAR